MNDKLKELVKIFRTQEATARFLGCSLRSLHRWIKKDVEPTQSWQVIIDAKYNALKGGDKNENI